MVHHQRGPLAPTPTSLVADLFPARRIMSLNAAGELVEAVFFNLTFAHGLLLLLLLLMLVQPTLCCFDDSLVGRGETKSPLTFSMSPAAR